MASLKLGLNLPSKNKAGSSKSAPAKRKPIFGDDVDDDDPTATPPTETNVEEIVETLDSSLPSKSSQHRNVSLEPKPELLFKQPPSKPSASKLPEHSSAPSLSALRDQRQQEASDISIDPSIYDYDAAHDVINAQRRALSATKSSARSATSGPRYMASILSAAETRKRDQLRARDRLLQKEREAEGDTFADKEEFVTDAYRAQQEEVRRAEEEERKKEEEAKKKSKDGLGIGMQSFYREMIRREEREEREVEEALRRGLDSGDTGKEEEGAWEMQEKERMKAIKEAGGKVMLDEEGQVGDKRQLLSAGLNIAPSKKSMLPKPGEGTKNTILSAQMPAAKGTARKAMRERQSRMMEAQLEQAAKRAAEEEDEERKKMERAAKSRKTEGEISDAKARYLQRKREKEAAAAAAAAESK